MFTKNANGYSHNILNKEVSVMDKKQSEAYVDKAKDAYNKYQDKQNGENNDNNDNKNSLVDKAKDAFNKFSGDNK